MKIEKFFVNEECIGCRACTEIAEDNFDINDQNIAFLKKQPSNKKELEKCQEALDICPVGAIYKNKEYEKNNIQPIVATDNVKDTLDKYPQLKDVLAKFSKKFNRLLNPITFNSLAKFATFNDAAKITKKSICEILHIMNEHIGTADKLQQIAPDCIKNKQQNILDLSEKISWTESSNLFLFDQQNIDSIVEKISKLEPQENIIIFSIEEPTEIIKLAKGLNFKINIEKNKEFRISIFNPQQKQIIIDTSWINKRNKFDILDVRTMKTDPFDIIIKKAYSTNENEGFTLIQHFEPYPIINMLSEMGFDYYSEKISDNEFHIFFYKIPNTDDISNSDKTDIVIQSATPVAYPVIMRLLQSEKLRKKINIRELKVWEETEKHLAWITNGKADVSFSSLLTTLKIARFDVKIPALFVWDNFVLLTRYKAENFNDILGHQIHTPLFNEAPPAKITKYLIKASGLNPDDFDFVFGEPFGRPEDIYVDFVTGKADTAILREPEASYAIKIMKDRNEVFSVISFNDIWNKINPGFGSFPNAGIVFKGEFVRKNPQLAQTFLDELKNAIDWVNSNRTEAANLAFDIMRQPVDRIQLFLENVNFKYLDGDNLTKKIKSYFDVLTKENIIDYNIDEDFYNIFKL
jgi:NitT/TauT family transport system substrate-binding protein